MKNAEANVALHALQELAGLALPVAGAMKVRRIMRAVAAQAEDVEAERMKLIRAHAMRGDDDQVAPDEHGNAQFASDEDQDAFMAALSELMAATWEPEARLAAADLGERVEVRPAVLVALGELLED